jgi:tetratricopeptide (TPR) repeat protein
MAPEQIRGKPRPASDQYALGVTVYEWLCGARPFDGSLAIEIAMKHITEPPPPLRDKIPILSPEIEKVVMKALAKEPQQRFGSIQEFAYALEDAYKKDLVTRQTKAREKAKEQWLDEGYVHFTAQRFKEAVTACSLALELDPTYALACYYRGYVYYHLKEYQKALADFDCALALNASNAIAYYNRANVYRDLKQYQQAIQDYERALELEPDLSQARANRAEVYRLMKG